jgi:hypothetical protein
MTKAERAHLSRLADLGCVLCIRLGYYATPAEIHHIRDGQGMSQRASHFDAIPLCYSHHRGQDGFHGLGKRAFIRRYGVDEIVLLQETKRMLQVAA